MATAVRPRQKARASIRPVRTVINASEMPEGEMPDISFEGRGRVDDAVVKVTYCVWPGTDDELAEGIRSSYVGLYLEDGVTDDVERRIRSGADLNDYTPNELRLLARVLTSVADQMDKELPRRLAMIHRAYGTIGTALDELYGED